MALPAVDKTQLSRMAQCLVSAGLLDKKIAQKFLSEAKNKQKNFVTHLVESERLDPLTIAMTASQYFDLPLMDLDNFDKKNLPLPLIDQNIITKHHALPLFQRNDRLYIALSDPSNLNALNAFEFHANGRAHAILVEEDKLATLIKTATTTCATNKACLEELVPSNEIGKNAPVVRFVHTILLDAIDNHISDIHFEPYEKMYRIRYRRDGLLYEAATPPLRLAQPVTTRLKVMSQLDISESRLPQDGHFKIKRSKTIDFRMSTCPTTDGEKIVLRILNAQPEHLGIDDLGFEADQKALFLNAIAKPQGMVLITGPTGSGKTMTLYTALQILNSDERNILTIEDPVEIQLQGINQVNVNRKAGLEFSTALRSFLRQDPDTIMIGEMRDLETAQIAIQAAQTGHLVLSTLHTNSASETLTRLQNMGIPAFNIVSCVSVIVAQRLVRKLCPFCKQAHIMTKKILLDEGFYEEDLRHTELFCPHSKGCKHCKNGYSGRIGIYETLKMTDHIARIIINGGTSMDIFNNAKQEGMSTLRDAGLLKVKKGITSLEEINRVTQD